MKGPLDIATIGLLFACTGCWASEGESTSFAGIDFEAPAGWTSQDVTSEIRQWVPEPNPERETLIVMSGRPVFGLKEKAYEQTKTALRLLDNLQMVGAGPIATANGLEGMRYDVRFQAGDGNRMLRRSHVVLVVDDRTVHVLYTRSDSNESDGPMGRVIESAKVGG